MDAKKKSAIRESFSRIQKLIKLQFAEKFTLFKTGNKRSLIYSILFKLFGFVIGTIALYFVLKFFRDSAGFSLNEGVLGGILFLLCLVCFLSTISRVFKNLYNVKDNQFLFTLPVTSNEVFVSKIVITFMQEIITAILLSLTFQTAFSLVAGGMLYPVFNTSSFSYVFMVLFTTFILPIMIVLLATLISIPVVLLIKFIKKHTVAVIISLIIILSLSLIAFSLIVNLVVVNISLVGQWFTLSFKLQTAFDNFAKNSWIFMTLANMYNGVGIVWGTLVIFAITIILFFATYYIMKPFYFKISVTENIKQKNVMNTKSSKQCKTVFGALIKKNIQMLWQNPSQFFSFFTILIIMPFIILLVDKFFNALYLRDLGYELLFGSNLAMISIFALMGNIYSGTGVSQEGSNYYLLKSGPVSYYKQGLSKVLINFVISVFFIIVSSFIACITTKITFVQGIIIILCASVLSLSHILYSYSYDFAYPFVSWYDSSQFQKSKNIGRTITIGLVWGIIYGAFTIKFIYLAPPSRALIYMIIIPFVFLVFAIRSFYLKLKYHTAKI